MKGFLRLAPVVAGLAILQAAGMAAAQEGGAAVQQGKEVFMSAEPACSICHTLADAGAAGKIGPNLDTLQPTVEKVRNALLDGPGAMPAYGELLNEQEIDAVAEYVAKAAGQSGAR